MGKKIKFIATEEHFVTRKYLETPELLSKLRITRFPHLVDKLSNIGEQRIAEMDNDGVDMQILSLNSTGVEQLSGESAISVAKETNQVLAEAIKNYPTRLAGLAAIPTSVPEAAAEELNVAVTKYGFKGAVINGNICGKYLDNECCAPFLEQAEKLQVPIYLHPAPPPQGVTDIYYTGNFSPDVSVVLSTSAWGQHTEVGLHVMRMIVGGVFDRYPNLQVIVGHNGEFLPFMLDRANIYLPKKLTKLERNIAEYLRENVYYTCAAFYFLPSFLDLLMQVGADRIMFAVDYPFASMKQGVDFIKNLPICDNDKYRIAFENAEKLFKISL